MFINVFIRFKNQLEDINEGECPATLMDQFLDQIKNNKYEVTVTNSRMEILLEMILRCQILRVRRS